jgi:hypothetical protein
MIFGYDFSGATPVVFSFLLSLTRTVRRRVWVSTGESMIILWQDGGEVPRNTRIHGNEEGEGGGI